MKSGRQLDLLKSGELILAEFDYASTEHHAKIFSKEEMDETWALMLHALAFGNDTADFEYAEWMKPLAAVFKKHYCAPIPLSIRLEDSKENAIIAECMDAYKAGLLGDLDAVSRFVGGQELAESHEPILGLNLTALRTGRICSKTGRFL